MLLIIFIGDAGSLFISMSFIIPLDYSVVNMRVMDHQPAVMMYNKTRAVLM